MCQMNTQQWNEEVQQGATKLQSIVFNTMWYNKIINLYLIQSIRVMTLQPLKRISDIINVGGPLYLKQYFPLVPWLLVYRSSTRV